MTWFILFWSFFFQHRHLFTATRSEKILNSAISLIISSCKFKNWISLYCHSQTETKHPTDRIFSAPLLISFEMYLPSLHIDRSSWRRRKTPEKAPFFRLSPSFLSRMKVSFLSLMVAVHGEQKKKKKALEGLYVLTAIALRINIDSPERHNIVSSNFCLLNVIVLFLQARLLTKRW